MSVRFKWPPDLAAFRFGSALIWALHSSGGGGIPVTITGVSPLSLVNAVAGVIESLYRYGWCKHEPHEYLSSVVQQGKVGQNGTPTPDAPVDIVCNNGALHMVHRSGLPSGYKLLEYVGGSGSQYVITDLYLASTDVIECEYCNSSTTGYGAIYGVFSLGESSALYGNQTYYSYDSANKKVDTDMAVDTEWHSSRHDFVNGTLTIDDTTVTFTPFEFVNSTKNAVLSRYYNNSYGYNWKGYIRKFKVTRNGEVICDLLPAKNSDDVAGLYDLATGAFYTATVGTLLEGNVVDDYELSVVGTPEIITAGLQTATVVDLFGVGDYADTQDIISGVVTRRVGIKVLDGTETWGQKNETDGRIITRLNDAINQASAPIIVTHGQWSASAAKDSDEWRILAGPYLCCYSSLETTADFKAFLAEQYAVGKPVIVIYPLAEEVTESAAPQVIVNETIVPSSEYIDNIVITTAKSEWTTPDVNHPLNIICNNGVVTVNGALGPVETITISANNVDDQTFTVVDLLGVGDYKDMEEVISGAVTRKCAVCVYDGTQSVGNPYISTTGGLDVGATIVYYTGGEVVEQTSTHELTVVDGNNAITSSVTGAEMQVTYPVSQSNSLADHAIVGTAKI